MFRFLHLAFLFVILASCYNIQKFDITGVWYFDRFGGPHGEIAKSSAIVEANMSNKGLMITFTRDNKMISTQTGGLKENNSTTNYQVFYNRKEVIIRGDTLRIMLLTADILELYPKDESRPALFLKRSKDGKTSMSAP